MGASMHFLRIRLGVIATAATAALLSLPVVAAGQVPSVGGVVGGVTDQLPSLPAPALPAPALPAPSLPALPQVQTPAPAPAPAPVPKLPALPSAPAPALPQAPVPGVPNPGGTAPAPAGSSPSQSAPSAGRSAPSSNATAGGSGKASNGRAAESGGQRDGGGKAKRSYGEAGGLSEGLAMANTDADLASAAVQGDAADLPDNPSPDTAPFTGLQLAYLVAMGLMLATAGLTVRRMARR